ncbi:MAG: PQQ-binding-like beta-propeller repeat protein [Bryobacterales bacterium]|nr:PQQ-binding-like beta-propeller repeat protein [Bryobacterales bacterium]MBV9397905.1 PQQ-binding-like beta-propeller repeat protein [Bryobacterales bacterium]
MIKTVFALSLSVASTLSFAQVQSYQPVTKEMLENPSPDDWLMFSRTYDAQRFSPLKQITNQNVGQLHLAWVRGLANGQTETIPIVHNGVMYVISPGAAVEALNAVNGDLLWEYQRKVAANVAGQARSKSLAIYQDIVVFTAPDAVVGLDAKTGEPRWEAKTDGRGNTSGPLIADGKVISGGACAGKRDNCFIAAHDALTGKELWRFYTTPGPGEPGDETWNGADIPKRLASTWGLPGTYDPARKMLYWGVANPMPDQRADRHNGNPDATSRTAPADLYSNSTIALDPATGKLAWYYQHLPADDWDSDYTHERTLVRTTINPDPKFVKWINPDVPKGQPRDVVATIGEAGGIFVLDRNNGQFLWATPFPYDDPNFVISNLDPKTGRTTINWNNVFKQPGDHHVVCYWNTRSYWPTAYSPVTNSLYTSYIDNCRDLTTNGPAGRGSWKVVPRPGGDPNALTGLAKINLSTGEILRFDIGRAPGNGAMLTTAGDLVFHGDMSRRFRAFDAANGKMLWESVLGGNISVSTISYGVNGKQYICVMTGDNLKVPELSAEVPELRTPRGHNSIYVFALP